PAFRGARGERLQPLPGTVTRGVVAGHDLVGKARLGKQAVQLRVEEALAVVRAQRHRYAHAQPSPPRPHIEASTRNGRGVMPSTPVNSLLSTTRSASSRDTGPRVAGSSAATRRISGRPRGTGTVANGRLLRTRANISAAGRRSPPPMHRVRPTATS